jgi:hypothetical protein
VGPVGAPKALLKPCPEAMEAPMRPISQPKPKLFRALEFVGVADDDPAHAQNSAMATIQNCEVRIRAQASRSRSWDAFVAGGHGGF